VEPDRKHHLEARDAGRQRIDTSDLGGDTIFMNNSDQGSIWLWAVDQNKGRNALEEADRAEGPEGAQGQYVLAFAGDRTGKRWVMSGNGHVRAFDFAGKELWRKFFKTTVSSDSITAMALRPY
jgi:hypothetical protein